MSKQLSKTEFITRRFKLYYKLIQRRQRYGMPPPSLNTDSCICKNCGHHFYGNVCNKCGQGRNIPRITYKNTIKNFFSIMFHINHGFWLTSMELLYRPGYMIKDYIAGKRIRYYHPFAMLFVVGAIYIIMAELMYPNIMKKKQLENMSGSERIELVKEGLQCQYGQEDNNLNKQNINVALATINKINNQKNQQDKVDNDKDHDKEDKEDNKKKQKLLKEYHTVEKVLSNFSINNSFLKNVSELLLKWFKNNRIANIILTLPFLAFTSRFVFRKAKHKCNTTEHFIVQTYIISQILILSLFYLPFRGSTVNDTINIAFLPMFLVYTWDVKQLFGYSWLRTAWKVILIMIYAIILLLILCIILISLLVLIAYIANLT
jgi:hypothetical protein